MSKIKIEALYQSNVKQGAEQDKQAVENLGNVADSAVAKFNSAFGKIKNNNFGKLSKQAEKLKTTLGSIQSQVNISKALGDLQSDDFATVMKAAQTLSKEYANLSGESKTTASASNGLKSALQGMDFPLKNFAKSLLRIAKLRLLRGIIRSITGAFKEGLSNIYQYSAAMNNMDASHMKGSMDSLASSLLYMKNAVASAVAPLIAQLVPVIAQVANWFVTAASAVAQFFAALGGATTYTRAKKEAVEWGNVASGAGGAAAAAQEYKNTILGFDEIHALNDVPSNGGGGGGGGGASPDFSNMFEEAEVSQKIKDLVQWIKDHMEDILDIAKAIGAVLLTWKLSKALKSFFDGLGLGKASKGIQVLAGLAISIIGFQLSYKGGYDIGYEGPDLMNIIKAGIGVALGGIGGAMIATAVGASGVIGFTIGAVISLAILSIGIQMGQYEKLMDTTYRTSEAFDQYSATMQVLNGIMADNGQLVTFVDGVTKDYAQTAADIAEAKVLLGYIEELNNPINRSAIDTEKLKAYTEQLNELGLEGITAQFNEESGMVEFSTDKVNEHLDALLKTAKTEAYLDILKEAWKAEAKAVIDSGIAEETFRSSNQETQDAIETINQYLEEHYGLVDAVSWAYGEAGMNMSPYAAQILNTDDNLKILQKTVEDNIEATNKAADAWKAEQDELSTASSYAADAEQAYRNLKDGVDVATVSVGKGESANTDYDKALKDMTRDVQGATKDLSYYGVTIDDTSKKKYDGKNVSDGMNNVKNAANDAKNNINYASGAVDSMNGKNPSFWNVRNVFWNLGKDADNANSKIWGVYHAIDSLNGKGATVHISTSGRVHGGGGWSFANGGFVPGFANGGYIPSYATGGINSASLFMARENGLPEMVGQIGGHTAVANNGQIVEAVSRGVANAVSMVMGNGSNGNVEVNVTLDGQRIARAVDNANRVRNRRFNVQA